MKQVKIMFSLSLALTLSACGEKAIDTVKSSPLEGVDGVTTAELLEGRTLCTNPRWEEQETKDKDVSMVEFRCTLKGGKAFFTEIQEAQLEKKKQSQRDMIAYRQDMLDHEISKLEKARKDLSLAKEAVDNPERHPRIVELKEEIATFQEEQALLRETTIEDFEAPKEEWGVRQSASREASTYFKAKERLAADPDNQRLAAKLERAERVLMAQVQHLIRVRDNFIAQRKGAIRSLLPRASDDAQRSISRLERQIIHAEEQVSRQEASVADMKARNAESLADMAKDIASVDEVFRWKLVDGKVNPIDAKVAMVDESGKQKEWDYQFPHQLPELIHRREVEEDHGEVDMETYFEWRFAAKQLRQQG